MAQLISTYEVLTYSPAGAGFPIKPVQENLDGTEEEIKNGCLGEPLFDYLVSKLSPTAGAMDWQTCGDYALNDLVIRNGVYYKSTATQNNTDPVDAGSDWIKVEKFTEACANSLWTGYLRKILAYRVYYYALPFATMTSGAGGLKVQGLDNRGERAATPAEIGRAQMDAERIIAQTTENMVRWLSHENQAACGFPSLGNGVCQDCETQSTNSRFLW